MLFRSRDFSGKSVEFFHASSLKVESDKKLAWTLDGEYAEGESVTYIKTIHREINFIVPKKYIEAKK